MDWMVDVAVSCEPLSGVGFPASREKCRENTIFGRFQEVETPKSARSNEDF